jgi:hypothetical protein
MSDIERIRCALSFIPPDSSETLLRMGTAIKDGLGDEGFWIWNEWVQRADPSVRAAAGIFADRQPWNSGAEDSVVPLSVARKGEDGGPPA